MTQEICDRRWVADNMRILKNYQKSAERLLGYWQKLLPDQPITTAHLHKWLKDKDYPYTLFREQQLAGGMTAPVFDALDEKVRRPPWDEPVEYTPPNPLQPTRHGPGSVSTTKRTGSGRPVPTQLFPWAYQTATQTSWRVVASARENGTRIVVQPTWLEVKGKKVVIPSDAEKRIREVVTIKLDESQATKAQKLEAALDVISELLDKSGKLPLKKGPGGKLSVDHEALAKK